MNAPDRQWNLQAQSRSRRLTRAAASLGHGLRGKRVADVDATQLLTAILEPGDRVCLEGNNQKQADFLARALTQLDPAQVHDLHMVQSVLALPEHL
uniref:malonate decarboxylase subunit alpha n=1 Tax=Rhodoferax sp. TaxID=50421 RepID=UPI00374DFBB3